ncbi:MAG: bifunctional serine/threonine-protein kinase/formylglycine-generating enzyme family protein [Planctomycetota bacterium]
MDPARWERVQALFHAALELPRSDREHFLAARCGEDEELLALVTRMLRAHESDSKFLEAPRPGKEEDERPIEGPIGPFEIVGRLGTGGMGVVVRARDPRLGRDVALKLISTAPPTPTSVLDRFTREAKAIARLRHHGIVPVHEVGEDHGYRWFSMDLYENGDLNRELQAQRGEKEHPPILPLPGSTEHLPAVLGRVAEVADALEYAHGRGIVHRDVKPHNLLLDDEERLCLVDFGLAKDESQGSVSATGDIGGTPHYMSPEQAVSDRSRIDHRTDIYSLGVVLYEMLTLQRPYSGKTAQQVITSIIKHDAPPLRRLDRELPRDLELVCSKAMAREPVDRYDSAAEFAADLRRILAYKPVLAKRPSLARRVERFVRRHRIAVAASALALVAAAASLQVGTSLAREERASREFHTVAPMLGREDWLALPLAERMQVATTLPELEREKGLLDRDTRDGVEQLGRRLAEHEGRLLAEARSRIARALSTPRGIEAFDGELLFSGTRMLAEAVALYGEEVLDVRPEVEAWRPLVRVTAVDENGAPLRGRAFAREIDPTTGVRLGAIELGSLPLAEHRLPPGHYRIVVEPEGRPSREYTRVVRAGSPPIEVVATIDDADPTSGMVPVAGGALSLPSRGPSSLVPYEGSTVEVAPFLVDEALVSIGEYRRWLDEPGTPDDAYPAGWAFLRDEGDDLWADLADGRYDDLPMVGISVEQATAFAEAHAKRLLSQVEWDLLARGSEDRIRPYDEPERYRGAGDGATPPPASRGDMARHFLREASTVRSHEDARSTPHGLYHLLGNVREYTETLGLEYARDGSIVPRPGDCRLVGAPWYYDAERKTTRARARASRGPVSASFEVGFRCARSVDP